jgi:hypothetical protein
MTETGEESKPKKNDVKYGFAKKIFSIILVLLVLYIVDWGFLKNEVTSYEIMCPDDYDGCYTLRYSRYKIDIDKQKVIHWVEGFSPDTIDGCSIINRKNWKCEWNDSSAEFGFRKGTYFSYSLKENVSDMFDDEIHGVSRFTYLLYQWGVK